MKTFAVGVADLGFRIRGETFVFLPSFADAVSAAANANLTAAVKTLSLEDRNYIGAKRLQAICDELAAAGYVSLSSLIERTAQTADLGSLVVISPM